MPRITHVKKAQQRYATVVVKNADGTVKRTPVMDRDGEQKLTKHGRPVFMTVTERDLAHPLPLLVCESCGEPIQLGTPYKHMTPKSGPYGGTQRNRHESCPTWQPWDYSNALSARVAQIAHDFHQEIADVSTPEDVTSALESAAGSIREIAEEKRTSASNIEEGFGHETEKSAELNTIADDLDGWADDVEAAEVPELPEPEETDCEDCEGTGEVEAEEGSGDDGTGMVQCATCAGSGRVEPEEPDEDQMAEWRESVSDAVSIVDECPV